MEYTIKKAGEHVVAVFYLDIKNDIDLEKAVEILTEMMKKNAHKYQKIAVENRKDNSDK